MALINDVYVFVETEEISIGAKSTEHPVEKGFPITDNVRREAIVINLKGEIVGENATKDFKKIKGYCQKGTPVKYTGVRYLNQALVKNLKISYSSKIKGGCSFTAEIQEMRVAKSPFKAPAKTPGKKTTSAGTQQVKAKEKKKRYYTVKKGDCLWNIAKSYYGNGAMYSKIVKANKEKIKNPNVIHIGWRLEIPY